LYIPISITIFNHNFQSFTEFKVIDMTVKTNATGATVGQNPDKRRYCIWRCPTHETNQLPQGLPVKRGCGEWQYRVTDPEIRSQGRCKNKADKCHKKPRLDEGNYRTTFPYNPEGKKAARELCEALNQQGVDY
jgi:hypothetical protein